MEFLTGRELVKSWVVGWCAAPGIILSFTIWWLVMLFSNTTDWTEPPWDGITVVAVTSLSFLIFFGFAIASVVKQVQYDFLGVSFHLVLLIEFVLCVFNIYIPYKFRYPK